MVDGKGISRKWAPYWHQCGLCSKGFRPHYILHFEHAQKDEEVKTHYYSFGTILDELSD